MRKSLLLGALALLSSTAVPAPAQHVSSNAALSGRIHDQTGREMPGVAVTAANLHTKQTWTSTTDDRGRYRFLSLPVGDYEVNMAPAGFAPFSSRVSLALGAAVDLPATLRIAGVQQNVDVTAEAPMVETGRTQAAERVTPAEVQMLPLNGRNYLDLALLTPGVSRTNANSTQRFAETSAVPGTGLSIAGQRNLHTGFIVDGLSANDDAADLAGTFYSQEVIREFQAITSGGIAEFGRASGGIVNIATQSGTNQWMGRTYGFFRDDSFDAPSPFATRKTPLSQQQYGATLSGPLRRDRMFLFGNVELTSNDQTGFVTIGEANAASVNAALEAAGYPGPRAATGPYATGYDTTNVFLRLDQQLRDSSQVAVRYNLYDIESDNARGVGGLGSVSRGTALINRDHVLSASLVTPISGSAINDLKMQFTRSRLRAPENDLVGPAVNIAGVANIGMSTSSPTMRNIDLFEIADSVSAARGSHLVKAGLNVLFNRVEVAFPGPVRGLYNFSSLSALHSGRYTTFQQAFGDEWQRQTNPNLGVFVQDQWQPRADLTVNLGFRYDVQWLADSIQTDTDNLAPRLGAAYAPGDRKTVLRASYGLFYDRIPLRAVSNALQRDGTKYRVAVLALGQEGAPVFPNITAGFPDGVVTAVTSVDPALKSGVSHQTSLQLERALSTRASVSAGFLRTRASGIIMLRNINVPTLSAADAAARGIANLGRPDARIGNNSQYQSIGDAWFNGMTLGLTAQKPGLATVRVSYTLSKALDTAGNFFFSGPQDNFDVAADKGRSDNDQRHRLVVSGSVSRGGWAFSYIYSYASSLPFNIVSGTDLNNDTNNNDRPGGVARNAGEAFSSRTLDVRLSRRVRITGRREIELMVEGFNVLNRANYLIPNNTFGPGAYPADPLPSFGRPTAAGDSRQMQVGIRFGF